MTLSKNIQREITPISHEDLFIVLDRPNARFDYPPHYHSDYELNLVINSRGKRIVGNSVKDFGFLDLVLVGPNVPHAWKGEIEEGNHVVTIQFHDYLLDFPILKKRLFEPIKNLLQRSSRGIEFSEETKSVMKRKILAMTKTQGFDTALHFLSILYELAVSRNQQVLADSHFSPGELFNETKSRRVAKVCEYVEQHYQEPLKLEQVAKLTGMSDSAFSHFFKKKTQRNFIDFLNDIRIGHASRMLFETSHSISEICYACGFNNISNFIRTFKKKNGQMTPNEYRIHIKQSLTKF
ncbi:MAG: AraC family transcriptional regulator [Dysgonamonadaceae bacterium]|jgi:AraC-like DNA-binding protein|nr:AraC family transcriptional regulator [Dysgonamonadaceae bacterium]